MNADKVREEFLQVIADAYDEAKIMGKDGDYIKAVCDVTGQFTLKELIAPTIREIYSGKARG